MQTLNNFKLQNKTFEIIKDNFKIKQLKTFLNELTKDIFKQLK